MSEKVLTTPTPRTGISVYAVLMHESSGGMYDHADGLFRAEPVNPALPFAEIEGMPYVYEASVEVEPWPDGDILSVAYEQLGAEPDPLADRVLAWGRAEYSADAEANEASILQSLSAADAALRGLPTVARIRAQMAASGVTDLMPTKVAGSVVEIDEGNDKPLSFDLGPAYDLTGMTVTLSLMDPADDDAEPVDIECDILDAEVGKCSCTISGADTASPGRYTASLRFTPEGGEGARYTPLKFAVLVKSERAL